MELDNIKPSDTYEGLKRQFLAMKTILQTNQAELNVYRKRIKEFNFERVIQLEAELESQKEMNAILTQELENEENKNEADEKA